MSSVDSSLATTQLLLQYRLVLFWIWGGCWSFAAKVYSSCWLCLSTGFGMPGREDRHPPEDGDGREGRRESDLAVTDVYPGADRSGGRATRSLTRDDTRLLDDLTPVLPTDERSRIHVIRSGKLLPGGCLVVNFRDDQDWDPSRLFLWSIDANTWIVLTPDGDKCAEKFVNTRGCECLPLKTMKHSRLVLLSSVVVGP